MNSDLILIGRITGAHGIRGAVKLKSFAAHPADLARYKPLQTSTGAVIEIVRMKPARDEFIADLRGIKDRNQAEALKGTELFVARDRLPQPQENEIYLHDLLGKRVMHEGVAVGVLTGFQNFGAGELLELDTGLLIPALFITSNETDVVVALPEDFLEDAARP